MVLNGVTGVGKTLLSIRLAKDLDAEIVSCDSAQVYRGVDVCSDKITPSKMGGIPHYMLDTTEVTDECSAAEYARTATDHVHDIIARGKTAMVVGGSSMYMSFLLCGTDSPPPSARSRTGALSDQVNLEIDELFQSADHDWSTCLRELALRDRSYASTLKLNDWRRLRRGLEICLATPDTKVSDYKPKNQSSWRNGPFKDYDVRHFFLIQSRTELYRRVDARCLEIVSNGLVSEMRRLLDRGLVPTKAAGSVLGYKQLFELKKLWATKGYGEGGSPAQVSDIAEDFVDFVTKYQAATRSLVKQQEIWWRGSDEIMWYPIDGVPLHERVRYLSIMSRITRDHWEDEEAKNASNKEARLLTADMIKAQRRYIALRGQFEPVLSRLQDVKEVDVYHPSNTELIAEASECFRVLVGNAGRLVVKPRVHRRASWAR